MDRQSCPGPCQFCARCNSACDALEVFQSVDTQRVGALTPKQVAELMVELHPNFWTEKRTKGLLEAMRLNGKQSISFKDLILWLFKADEPEELVAPLNLDLLQGDNIGYGQSYTPLVQLTCGLIMIPHGSTVSNSEQLFQNHSDGAKSQLTPEGIDEVKRGAADFMREHGQKLRESSSSWVVYRSPLQRCKDTASYYQQAGVGLEEPEVDLDVIEINHGSWGGHSIDSLITGDRHVDAALAEKYRGGSFLAKAEDGSGECLLEVVSRAGAWLEKLQARHGSERTNVVVFGHGTFQNAVELLLRVHPEREPKQLFTRVTGGSHLRRGHAHIIAQLL